MAIRDTLVTGLTANLATSNVSVSSELPFNSGGVNRYISRTKSLFM